jgi:hypothetical protein
VLRILAGGDRELGCWVKIYRDDYYGYDLYHPKAADYWTAATVAIGLHRAKYAPPPDEQYAPPPDEPA